MIGDGTTGTAWHSTVTLAGMDWFQVGACVSRTVIVWVWVVLFPQLSSAIQVRVSV